MTRHGGGIKVVRPDRCYSGNDPVFTSHHSVAGILQLPCCVYFLNQDSTWEKTNDHDVEACGALSAKDVLGKNMSQFASTETARFALENDAMVMSSDRIHFLEEDIVLHDDVHVKSIGIKFPWYGSNDEVIGLIGFSMIENKHSVAETLSRMTALGLLDTAQRVKNNYPLRSGVDGLSLTPREMECLRHYVRGLPAKAIADKLYLSKRTVENYIQNIKSIIGVSTKAQLIYKTVQLFGEQQDS